MLLADRHKFYEFFESLKFIMNQSREVEVEK